MHKVVSINLDGRAYQVEEHGFSALTVYLEDAADRLEGNPGRTEILADLEQAIASRCDGLLHAHKTVVTTAEVEQIIRDMGPVEVDGEEVEEGAREVPPAGSQTKRLYQIREGAMLSGVCNGLGAYLDVDPTLVRIAFVVLAFVTSGVWVAIYGVLMIVIPHADTPEERAAATGLPLNAQEVIDRAARAVNDLKDRKPWRDWRRQHREWQRRHPGWKPGPIGYTRGPVAPAAELVRGALFLLFAIAAISVVNSGTALGWPLPLGLPVWGALLILVATYNFLSLPLHLTRSASGPAEAAQWWGVGGTAIRLAVVGVLLWLAINNAPEVREFVQRLPGVFRAFLDALRSLT
jgi:phage shock protein PspC (stress-responsive transcriptional regulator)